MRSTLITLLLWLAFATPTSGYAAPAPAPAPISLEEYLAAHDSPDWSRYELMDAFRAQPNASRAIRPLFELVIGPLRAGRADWESRANDSCLSLSLLLDAETSQSLPPTDVLELVEAATDWTTVQKCGYVLAHGVARSGHKGIDERLAAALVPGLMSQRSRVRDSVTRTLVQLDPGLQGLDREAAVARALARWPKTALDPGAPPSWLRERVVVFQPVLEGDAAPTLWGWDGRTGSLPEAAAWVAAVAVAAKGRYTLEPVIQIPWARVEEPWVDAASTALEENIEGLTISPLGDVFLPVWPALLSGLLPDLEPALPR